MESCTLILAILTWLIIVFLAWDRPGLIYMVPMFIHEVGLGLWLVVKGIREPIST